MLIDLPLTTLAAICASCSTLVAAPPTDEALAAKVDQMGGSGGYGGAGGGGKQAGSKPA